MVGFGFFSGRFLNFFGGFWFFFGQSFFLFAILCPFLFGVCLVVWLDLGLCGQPCIFFFLV